MRSGINDILRLLFFLTAALFTGCQEEEDESLFSVAFMTDIHVQPERDAAEGFTAAIHSANRKNVDLIITGGDLIMDALDESFERASTLFDLYNQVSQEADMPVYNTMGNHDIYGIFSQSGADPNNPEYGENMYENRIGESYYSFEYEGWKFFILNSAEDAGSNSYKGYIDDLQMQWIGDELGTTDPSIPLVIVTHIPFVSALAHLYQAYGGSDPASRFVTNADEVIDLFEGYNLKLVLQGHHHFTEDIRVKGVHYVTGGAVAGSNWQGPYLWFEEGYMLLTFTPDDFTWDYIDYGWEAVK